MSPRFFEYRGFEVTAVAERSFTTLWVATYHAFPFAESASESVEEVLSYRFLCDGQNHKLVQTVEEAIDEAAALARAAIDMKLLLASMRK